MSALAKYKAKHGHKPDKPMKRVATVAVMHGERLLMGKRRDNGKYTTPGGHLEAGEDFATGAARELEEESGIKAPKGEIEAISEPKTVTKPDGEKIQVQPFLYVVNEKPETTMTDDPDAEVHRWKWVDIEKGLPADVAKSLHVPLKDNVLTAALGLCAEKDKTMGKCPPHLEKYMKKKGASVEEIEKMHSGPLEDAKGKSPAPETEEDYGAKKGKKK